MINVFIADVPDLFMPALTISNQIKIESFSSCLIGFKFIIKIVPELKSLRIPEKLLIFESLIIPKLTFANYSKSKFIHYENLKV